ncbi:hypothetical protein CsSME_00016531 [Camellia sinensis var. sinensis]
MVGPPSFYRNKPTTLDLLELGIEAGGASTVGLSALFTSIGGGLDIATAAASFGGVNSSAVESRNIAIPVVPLLFCCVPDSVP